MSSTTLLVFDLDDTLYLERDYVTSGFQAVGKWVSEHLNFEAFSDLCETEFSRGTRNNIFNRALATAGLVTDEQTVLQLVEIYRGHMPNIHLAADAETFLSDWTGSLGLITDGPFISQTNKCRALNVDRRFDHCILTDTWGKQFWKPHQGAFLEMQRRFGVSPTKCTYVGDNPEKDFLPCRQLGWHSVRLRRAGGIHFQSKSLPNKAADVEISTLDELSDILLQSVATR